MTGAGCLASADAALLGFIVFSPLWGERSSGSFFPPGFLWVGPVRGISQGEWFDHAVFSYLGVTLVLYLRLVYPTTGKFAFL